jgi:DUF177 domain-containing protein
VSGPGRHALVVPVADLLRRPGSARDERREAVLGGLAVSGSTVPEGELVTVDAHLESVNEGIVVTGHVRAPWRGECRRCLRQVEDEVDATLLEVFEPEPVEGETRRLEGTTIDLEPVARESVLLELPLAPLCTEACRGLCDQCGADRNADPAHAHEAPGDPRWSALDALRFE